MARGKQSPANAEGVGQVDGSQFDGDATVDGELAQSLSDLIAQASAIAKTPQESAALHALTASLTDLKRRADTVAEHLAADDFAPLMAQLKAL
jgi:hypothetical protein